MFCTILGVVIVVESFREFAFLVEGKTSMNMGPLVKYSVCLLILSSLYLSLDAQNVAGLADASVGTYQYQGPRGDREFINSVGGAKVGIFRRVQPPRYSIRIPLRRQPVRPPPIKYQVKPLPPPPKKPGVGYRQGGVLGGLLTGLLSRK